MKKIENIQKKSAIKWHDATTDLPEEREFVLGYDKENKIYAVVKWDCVDWSDDNEVCYNVDYWTELPEVII